MIKGIKEQEIQLLNLNVLRTQTVVYRIVDIMGMNKESSENEYVWDENSTLPDNNDSVIKLDGLETGRYIKRIDDTELITDDEKTFQVFDTFSILTAEYPASENPLEVAIVTTTTGIIGINQKQKGLYYSNGVDWTFLDANYNAAQTYYDNTDSELVALNVKAALDEIDAKTRIYDTMAYGIKGDVKNIISINTDPQYFNALDFEYFIDGNLYTAGGLNIPVGFQTGDRFRIVGVNTNGITLLPGNTFPEIDNIETNKFIPIAILRTTDGTTVDIVSNSYFDFDKSMLNLSLWAKFIKKTSFVGDSLKIEESSTPFQLTSRSGIINTANMEMLSFANIQVDLSAIVYYHSDGVLKPQEFQTPLIVDNTKYDDGTGLVDVGVNMWASHTLFYDARLSAYYFIYSQGQYDSKVEALKSVPDFGEFSPFEDNEYALLAKIIVSPDSTNIDEIVDVRNYDDGQVVYQEAGVTAYNNEDSTLQSTDVNTALHELDSNKADVDQTSSNIIVYPTNVSGDFGNNKLVLDINDPDYNDIEVELALPLTGSLSNNSNDDGPNTELVASFISSTGILEGKPGVVAVPGIFNMRRQNTSNDDGKSKEYASFYFKAFKRNSSGVEELVATSRNTNDVQAYSRPNGGYEYENILTAAIANAITWDITDRVVVKLYANTESAKTDKLAYELQLGGEKPTRIGADVPAAFTTAATALGTSVNITKTSQTTVSGALQELYTELEISSQVISTSLTIGADKDIYFVDTNTDIVITLPLSSSVEAKIINIKRIDNNYNDVLLKTSGTDLIDNYEEGNLESLENIVLIGNGTGWSIL